MSKASPSWAETNLTRHHAERLRKNPGCFEDLLGIVGRTITVDEYRDRSSQAFSKSWCEYEAQSRDIELKVYLKVRVHYVDDELVVAITDDHRAVFVTCFHEHFDNRQTLHGKNPGGAVSVAQRRIQYREDLRLKKKGRLIMNLKVIRDG